MILGRIVGTVVATRELDVYRPYKILVVQPLKPDLTPKGATLLAIDTVQAGAGDTVLVVDEGNSARTIIGDKMAPIRSVVAAIVDEIHVVESASSAGGDAQKGSRLKGERSG
jgi:ethanolamine utilization protein EutN